MPKVIREIERKYYKYIISSWTQPQLAGNGTIGGDYFAVLPSSERSGLSGGGQCFRAFDGASNTFWLSAVASVSSPVTCVIYNPVPINITSIYFSGVGGTTGKIQASTDGNTWIDIKEFSYSTDTYGLDVSNNTGFYNYYRLYYTAGGYHGSGGWYVYLNEISITATYRERIEESTSSDYDFYKDVDEYRCHKNGTTYSAFNI